MKYHIFQVCEPPCCSTRLRAGVASPSTPWLCPSRLGGSWELAVLFSNPPAFCVHSLHCRQELPGLSPATVAVPAWAYSSEPRSRVLSSDRWVRGLGRRTETREARHPPRMLVGALLPQGGLPTAQTARQPPRPPHISAGPRTAGPHTLGSTVWAAPVLPSIGPQPGRPGRKSQLGHPGCGRPRSGFRSLSFRELRRLRDRHSTGWPPVAARESGGRRLAGMSAESPLRAPF